jgi:hypothetical protein
MTSASVTAKATLTIAGPDLGWLMAVMQAAASAFSVTVVHETDPVRSLRVPRDDRPSCAVVELDEHASALDVRDLFARCPGVRFLFIASELPLRHAVARVIREQGHAWLSRDEIPVVIIATVTALLAERAAP